MILRINQLKIEKMENNCLALLSTRVSKYFRKTSFSSLSLLGGVFIKCLNWLLQLYSNCLIELFLIAYDGSHH